MEQQIELNEHNKQEYPPMHTTEHILNQTMVRMFGCERSKNAHIERKKSKCDYFLAAPPTEEEIAEIERRVNEVIESNVDVYVRYVSKEEAASLVDLSKLPSDASDTVRLVYVGDYDICACIGAHVNNTSEIDGKFEITSHDYDNGRWRMRFKLK